MYVNSQVTRPVYVIALVQVSGRNADVVVVVVAERMCRFVCVWRMDPGPFDYRTRVWDPFGFACQYSTCKASRTCMMLYERTCAVFYHATRVLGAVFGCIIRVGSSGSLLLPLSLLSKLFAL